MPFVARETDLTKCPAHAKGKIIEGEPSVLACFQPVARKDDHVRCKDGSIDTIVEGDATVLIGGKPVACKGHKTAHGGVIETGCPRVSIGRSPEADCMDRAAQKRSPLILYKPGKKPKPFPVDDEI